MQKQTTVTIDQKTFATLDRLAKSNDVSKKEFLSCAFGKSSVSCPLKPSDSAPLKHSTMPP